MGKIKPKLRRPELEAARERIEQLEAEGVTLADTALQASTKWRVACERIAELEKEKAEFAEAALKVREAHVNELKAYGWDGGKVLPTLAGIRWLGNELRKANADLGEATTKWREAHNDLHMARQENNGLARELQTMIDALNALNAECSALTEGNAMLGETLEESEKRGNNWYELSKASAAAQQTLQKEISRLASENEELNERNSNQYGKINDLRQAFEKLAVDKQAQIDDLREELTWYKERKP